MSKKIIEKFFNFTDYTFSKKHLYTIPKIEIENIENIDFSFFPKDSTYLELNKLIKYFQFIPIEKEEIESNQDSIINIYLNNHNIDFIKYSLKMIKKGEINASIWIKKNCGR